MSLEDEVRSLRELVTTLGTGLVSRLERIEARLPPNVGDRARVKEITRWSDSTISRRTKSGELRSIKIGGRRLWDLYQFSPVGGAEAAEQAVRARVGR